MNDYNKTKAELLQELAELRQEVTQLKTLEAECLELKKQLGVAKPGIESLPAKQILPQNEIILRTIIDSTPDWIFIKDREHRYRLVNQSYANSLHLTPADFIGKNDLELGFPEDIVKGDPAKGIRGFWADDREVMDSGQTKFIAEEPAVVDGQAVFLSTVKVPLQDMHNQVWGVLGFVQDITERKRAEEALRQSETRNRDLLSAIPDLIIRYRADGTYLDIKPSKDFQAFLPPSELIGKNLFEVAPLEVAQQRMHYIQLALQTGQTQTYEHIFSREDESKFEEIWVVPSEVGDEVFVVIRDITERRRAEETLRQNEALLRTIIDSTPDWILVKDREHRFQLVNQSFAASVHLAPADLLGKTDLDLGIPEEVVKGNPEKGIRGFWADDLEVMNSGQTKFIAEEPIVVDGQPAFLSTVKSPLRDANGEVWGLLVFVHDITQRKQAEEVLARRAAELQTVAQVGTATATILETDKLLQEVVDLTKGSFRLYHAHIYLLNEAGDTLMLAAGAGEVGRQMVAQGWSIPLERERSLVAQAARTRQGVIANNVRQAPGFLPNPLLPDTRAEMALPLIRGEQLLGVLDVQADTVDYFSNEDVQIQTILAGQIAAALQNARSFAEQQQTQRLLSERVKELNCLNEISREIVESPPVPELLQWVTERIPPAMRYPALCQAAVEYEGQIYGRPQAIELPCQMTHALRIGGEVMGRIYISYTEKQEFLDEESALIGGIASRLSGYIESRRLLEQVQDALAAQEHLTVELDSQRRTLQAVLDNMPAGVFVAEAPSGKPLLANEQVKQLLGRGIALDVNKKETAEMYAAYRYGTDTLYPPDQTPLARGLLGESITIDDMEVRRPNGRRTLLQVVGAPIRNAQGSVSASVAIFQDITERKQAEETLKESEERFRAIAETSPIPILISSISDGLILYGNEQLGRTFGLAVADLIGQQTPDFYYDPADRAPLLATLKREGRLNDYELHVKKADGTPFWVLVSMQPLVFTGQPAMLAAFYDVTERKQVEETLRQNEALLRTVIDSTPDWIFIKDQNHRYRLVNQSYANSMHLLPQDFVGKNDLEIGFPEEIVKGNPEKGIKGFWADDREVMDSGETKFIAEEPAVLDGQPAFLSTIKVPLHDAQNQVSGVLGFVQIITTRKQAELERERLLAELQQSQQFLRTLLDNIPYPIFFKDVQGAYLGFNRAFLDYIGSTEEALLGKTVYDLNTNKELADTYHEMDMALFRNPETPQVYEAVVKYADGTLHDVIFNKVTFTNPNGSLGGLIGTIVDITERKRAEEVLRRSQEQLSGALGSAKLAYWEFDVATQTFTFNDQFYSLLRTTADQEGGYLMPAMHYAQKFVHPDDAYMVGVAIQEALETTDLNFSTQVDHRIIRADGSEGYFLVRFRVVKDEQGRTIRTIGANQDITERKQSEEALKAEQEWAQTILDSVTVPMVISRVPDGTILYANDPHSRFFSIAREQLIGQPTRNFFEDPAERDKFVALLKSQGTVNDYEVRIRKSNGEVRWALLSSRLFNFRGEAATMTIMIDITERKQADTERERLLGEVEATYRQYVQREWEHFLGEQHQGAVRIEHQATDDLALNIEPARLDAKLAGLQDEVISEGRTKVVAGIKENGHSAEPAIVAPIALRGQVIGTLSLQDLILDRQWSTEEVALVETVSEQLAQTLENLRLFEDTQKQATREQLTRQITDKLRAAPDMDTIIQTGLTELAKALNVSRAYVKLTTKPENE